MLAIRIKKGLDIPLAGVPQLSITPAASVKRVAFLAADFLSMRQLPKVLVEEGESVRLGQALVSSKQYPQIIGVSPGSGIVEQIVRGKKRALKAIILRLEGKEEQTFRQFDAGSLDALTATQVKDNLLATGMWLALRTRPYSMTPPPDSEPNAIYVTAIDTEPLAPPPEVIIAEALEDFIYGLQIVSKLCRGVTYLCAAPALALPEHCNQIAKVVRFTGPHPAGLVGTHIHHLSPLSTGDVVWSINYQDVIAIGRVFVSGRLAIERVVALSGPLMNHPRLVRTRVGASLTDLLEEEQIASGARIISGSVLSGRHALTGRHALGWAAYLGFFHHQVVALREAHQPERLRWIAPTIQKFSALRIFFPHWRARQARFDLDSSYHGSASAMLPIGVYERVMPLDLLITPLLRALLVGDIETAIELGCLELDEEDLALCSFVCPGKHDFGRVLREMLDKIQSESQI